MAQVQGFEQQNKFENEVLKQWCWFINLITQYHPTIQLRHWYQKVQYQNRSRIESTMGRKKAKEPEYQVQKISNKRKIDGVMKYKVYWKGYHSGRATWQPIEHLDNAQWMLRKCQKNERRKGKQAFISKIVKYHHQQLLQITKEVKLTTKEQLAKVLGAKLMHHNPVPEVQMDKEKQPINTFQSLLTLAPNQLLKVERYDHIKGTWQEQLQPAGQVIVRAATIQKNALQLTHQPILITAITEHQNKFIVHFKKGQKYQCELNLLRSFRPQQVIEYLLERYDPVQQRAKVPWEANEYFKSHSKQLKQ